MSNVNAPAHNVKSIVFIGVKALRSAFKLLAKVAGPAVMDSASTRSFLRADETSTWFGAVSGPVTLMTRVRSNLSVASVEGGLHDVPFSRFKRIVELVNCEDIGVELSEDNNVLGVSALDQKGGLSSTFKLASTPDVAAPSIPTMEPFPYALAWGVDSLEMTRAIDQCIPSMGKSNGYQNGNGGVFLECGESSVTLLATDRAKITRARMDASTEGFRPEKPMLIPRAGLKALSAFLGSVEGTARFAFESSHKEFHYLRFRTDNLEFRIRLDHHASLPRFSEEEIFASPAIATITISDVKAFTKAVKAASHDETVQLSYDQSRVLVSSEDGVETEVFPGRNNHSGESFVRSFNAKALLGYLKSQAKSNGITFNVAGYDKRLPVMSDGKVWDKFGPVRIVAENGSEFVIQPLNVEIIGAAPIVVEVEDAQEPVAAPIEPVEAESIVPAVELAQEPVKPLPAWVDHIRLFSYGRVTDYKRYPGTSSWHPSGNAYARYEAIESQAGIERMMMTGNPLIVTPEPSTVFETPNTLDRLISQAIDAYRDTMEPGREFLGYDACESILETAGQAARSQLSTRLFSLGFRPKYQARNPLDQLVGFIGQCVHGSEVSFPEPVATTTIDRKWEDLRPGDRIVNPKGEVFTVVSAYMTFLGDIAIRVEERSKHDEIRIGPWHPVKVIVEAPAPAPIVERTIIRSAACTTEPTEPEPVKALTPVPDFSGSSVTDRLERIKNRDTLYELAIVRGAERYRVCYAARNNRAGLWDAVTSKGRAALLAAFTGSPEITFAKRAKDGGTMGEWAIVWTGRTERDAIREGELAHFTDATCPVSFPEPTPAGDIPRSVKRVELLDARGYSQGDTYTRSAPGCWRHERLGCEMYAEMMNAYCHSGIVVFLPDVEPIDPPTEPGHKGLEDPARMVDVGPVPEWLKVAPPVPGVFRSDIGAPSPGFSEPAPISGGSPEAQATKESNVIGLRSLKSASDRAIATAYAATGRIVCIRKSRKTGKIGISLSGHAELEKDRAIAKMKALLEKESTPAPVSPLSGGSPEVRVGQYHDIYGPIDPFATCLDIPTVEDDHEADEWILEDAYGAIIVAPSRRSRLAHIEDAIRVIVLHILETEVRIASAARVAWAHRMSQDRREDFIEWVESNGIIADPFGDRPTDPGEIFEYLVTESRDGTLVSFPEPSTDPDRSDDDDSDTATASVIVPVPAGLRAGDAGQDHRAQVARDDHDGNGRLSDVGVPRGDGPAPRLEAPAPAAGALEAPDTLRGFPDFSGSALLALHNLAPISGGSEEADMIVIRQIETPEERVDALDEETIRKVLVRLVKTTEAHGAPTVILRVLNEWTLLSDRVADVPDGIAPSLVNAVEHLLAPRLHVGPVQAPPVARLGSALDVILATPIPSERGRIRRSDRKTMAAEVRKLFKELGIKGCSVTAPSYSMASGIDIRIPGAEEHDRGWQTGHDFATCDKCGKHRDAEKHIRAIVEGAFPDMIDRSDTQSDYHDNPLHIS